LHREAAHGETAPLIPERLRVADNPQQTIRELKELVIAYAKQETLDPLKGLGRYVAYGVGGALLIGTGVMFLAIGALRALEGDRRGPHFTGNWSWAPYAIVVVGALAIAGASWFVGTKKRNTKRKTS
jgi:Putative Actinobacterial Holin-X, holin superfamily III